MSKGAVTAPGACWGSAAVTAPQRSLTLSLEEDRWVRALLPRVLPSRPSLETFLQTLIMVLVPQQREVTVPRA